MTLLLIDRWVSLFCVRINPVADMLTQLQVDLHKLLILMRGLLSVGHHMHIAFIFLFVLFVLVRSLRSGNDNVSLLRVMGALFQVQQAMADGGYDWLVVWAGRSHPCRDGKGLWFAVV